MSDGNRPALERLAYSVREAAKICGMSKSTMYRLAESGRLRFKRVGKRTLVTREELLRFLDEANEQQ
jgi:excisionase family DNA binding protein